MSEERGTEAEIGKRRGNLHLEGQVRKIYEVLKEIKI